MKLTIGELSQLLQLSLAYLEQKKIQKIRFENDDYYPKFWRKDMKFKDTEFMKHPQFTLGSLGDDIEDVKYSLTDKFGFCPLYMEKLGVIIGTLGALLVEGKYFQAGDKKKCSELSIRDLSRLFKIMLWFIQWKEISKISFEKIDDCYLKVPHEAIDFNQDQFFDCPPYVIGSLTEDINDLKKVLAGEVKMDGVYLQKLGAVLTAIGETI